MCFFFKEVQQANIMARSGHNVFIKSALIMEEMSIMETPLQYVSICNHWLYIQLKPGD